MEHQAPYMIDFQEWQRAGLFEKMWQAGLLEYDNEKRIRVGMAKPLMEP